MTRPHPTTEREHHLVAFARLDAAVALLAVACAGPLAVPVALVLAALCGLAWALRVAVARVGGAA